MRLLGSYLEAVNAAGWCLVNVACTVVAHALKFAQHICAMCARFVEVRKLHSTAVNVKEETAEKLGPEGAVEAMQTRWVCLLVRTCATCFPGIHSLA